MRKLKVNDITLRQASNIHAKELSFNEKIEIAKSLDKLKADTIELAPISESNAEQMEIANKTMAGMLETRISAAVDISTGNIKQTWESVQKAKNPLLNIIAPVSTVQMEYFCKKKAGAMLALIKEKMEEALNYTKSVEFTAADAARAEPEFLYQSLNVALEAGASKITICDTAGNMMPDDFGAFIDGIMKNVPGIVGVELDVEINNSLHMALACAIQAIRKGVSGIKCTVLPNGVLNMGELAKIIEVKGKELDVSTQIPVTEIHRSSSKLRSILHLQAGDASRFPIYNDDNILVAAEVNRKMEDLQLGKNESLSNVTEIIRNMGYDLTDEDIKRIYKDYQALAEQKSVGIKELRAIIANSIMQSPPTYILKDYVITSGNTIKTTANIILEKYNENGTEESRGFGVGNGSIDASFSAIDSITGLRYELDDFQIQPVTEGSNAMGSAFVKLRKNGKVYYGNGLSTDVVCASIYAYINALNKILYEGA